MIEIVLVFGFVLFLGMAGILVKLPLTWTLRMLGKPLIVDVTVTVVTLIIHWGTMTGLLAAAVAGLICSIVTSIARTTFGYIEGHHYIVGKIDLTNRILNQMVRRT